MNTGGSPREKHDVIKGSVDTRQAKPRHVPYTHELLVIRMTSCVMTLSGNIQKEHGVNCAPPELGNMEVLARRLKEVNTC